MYRDCCRAWWWAEMKGEAGLLKLERAQSKGAGYWRSWNEAGRGGDVWQREVKERTQAAKLVPQGFGKQRSLVHTKTHTHARARTQTEWKCCSGQRSSNQPNKGLMPSSGLQAARPHYPEMDKSIWSNYIKPVKYPVSMETNVSRFAQKAFRVLNIAERVMCHCQMNIWTVA